MSSVKKELNIAQRKAYSLKCNRQAALQEARSLGAESALRSEEPNPRHYNPYYKKSDQPLERECREEFARMYTRIQALKAQQEDTP